MCKVLKRYPFVQESRSARTPPPLDSSGSSVNSESATSSSPEDKHSEDESGKLYTNYNYLLQLFLFIKILNKITF